MQLGSEAGRRQALEREVNDLYRKIDQLRTESSGDAEERLIEMAGVVEQFRQSESRLKTQLAEALGTVEQLQNSTLKDTCLSD